MWIFQLESIKWLELRSLKKASSDVALPQFFYLTAPGMNIHTPSVFVPYHLYLPRDVCQ